MKVQNCPTDLDRLGYAWKDGHGLLLQDDGAVLRLIVFEEKGAVFPTQERMGVASRHIRNLEVCFSGATDFELGALLLRSHNMHHSKCYRVRAVPQALQNDERARLWQRKIHQRQ